MIGFIANLDVNDMGPLLARIKDIDRIEEEIKYERNHRNRPSALRKMENRITRLRKDQTPRYRRSDLINSMPTGEQKRIAYKLKISEGYVSSILNGRSSQTSETGINVIRLAEAASEKARCKRVR